MKRGLCLISSGIDSPVAAYMMMDKLDLSFIHFDNQPFTNDIPIKKVIDQLQQLSNNHKKRLSLFIIKHGKNQAEFMKNCNRRFQCIFCRRIMLKVSEALANEENIDFLITGENLGQVASQTLHNLATEQKGINMPVLQPLLTNDKNETILLAKKIETYKISIRKDVCCFAVPKNPATISNPQQLEREEQKLDVNNMIKRSLSTKEKIIISPNK